MVLVFKPFTWPVWGLHVAVIVVGAFSIVFMEARARQQTAQKAQEHMNTDSITYLAMVQVEEVYTAENSETQTAQEAN